MISLHRLGATLLFRFDLNFVWVQSLRQFAKQTAHRLTDRSLIWSTGRDTPFTVR